MKGSSRFVALAACQKVFPPAFVCGSDFASDLFFNLELNYRIKFHCLLVGKLMTKFAKGSKKKNVGVMAFFLLV